MARMSSSIPRHLKPPVSPLEFMRISWYLQKCRDVTEMRFTSMNYHSDLLDLVNTMIDRSDSLKILLCLYGWIASFVSVWVREGTSVIKREFKCREAIPLVYTLCIQDICLGWFIFIAGYFNHLQTYAKKIQSGQLTTISCLDKFATKEIILNCELWQKSVG